MRLADFILRDMEGILVEWEAFAATLFPAAASMRFTWWYLPCSSTISSRCVSSAWQDKAASGAGSSCSCTPEHSMAINSGAIGSAVVAR